MDEILEKYSRAESTPLEQAIGKLLQRPGFLLRKAVQQSAGVFEKECSHLGLTVPQYYYLFLLDLVPELSQSELSSILGMDRSTNTLVLKILERKGWVKRTVDADDTRKRTVKITAAGRKVFQKTKTAGDQAIEAIAGALESRQYSELIRLLQKVVLFNGGPIK